MKKPLNYFSNSIIILITALFLQSHNKSVENEFSQPNIIIIFCDDLGYGDIGSFGATGFSTPHIDQLATEGMQFTDFYSAQAVCTASRASILTGCYANRLSLSGALMPWANKGLHKDEKTIAEILKEKGYAAGIFGKWHLGHQKEFLPLQHGFDEYVGLPYSNDMWPVDFAGNQITDTASWKFKYPQLPLIKNNDKIDEIRTLDDQSKLTALYTDKATDFIKRNKNQPFFLYLPHSMPHVPIAASEKFKGKSKHGLYGDVIMEIDWSVGEIMNTLKENGLDKNTLVVFTSDNGPWLNFGNHAGSSGGLREGKGTSWEGGQKVPCVMRWPGVIPAGTVCNKLASTIDLLPTITSIVNGKLPEHKIDGVNILSLMKGDINAEPRNTFNYYYRRNNLEAIRKDHWKLVFPHEGRSYENQEPGKDGFSGPAPENIKTEMALFDLRRDPGERYDVQKYYPDVVKELMALADKVREDLGDDLKNIKGKNVRESGLVKE